ncbi:hypothetical protein EB118_14310 [bacterium]|nr:hypothetical protein [bacterium]NBX98004.1 hypothetical protein [bacterium]NDC95185.1 hypothetical protein [bacterium]NDD84953.1 hypothetical protein [bacterium]NDG31230.1 hypothetical protein [bacterium]
MNRLNALTINNKYTKIMFVFAFILVAMLFIQSPKAYAVYDGSRLIDNAVFLDANTMNANQIQQFLVDKGAGLASRTFVLTCGAPNETTTMQAYASVGAPCGQTVQASSIIYYAAQIYGVNPRVILATMQKEQSLTTAANPTDWQISQAMGYACPTTGSCSSSSNFFYQIDNGTWVLRFHYERARGNFNWWFTSTSWTCGSSKPSYYVPNLYPGQNVTFIDPYSGAQYANVFIQNAATSAFYCYTPHVFNNHTNSPHPDELSGSSRCYPSLPASGSQGRCYTGSYNFVLWFEKWFGPTVGALVRTIDNPTVYLIDDGKKYPIADVTLLSDVTPFGPLRFITDAEINSYTTSTVLSRMFGSVGGTLYFVNAGMKLPFTSCAQVAHYGFSCSQVTYLSDGLLSTLSNAPALTQVYKTTSGKTFYIENGQKREVYDQQALTESGVSQYANMLLEHGLNFMAYGTPIVRDGTLIANRQTGGTLFVNQGAVSTISATNKASGLFNTVIQNNLDDVSVQKLPTFNLSGLVKNVSSTNYYVLTQLGKAQITNNTEWASTYMTLSNTTLAAIPNDLSGNVDGRLVIGMAGGTVYYVNTQTKRPIPSWDDLLSINIVPLKIASLPDFSLNSIATGGLFFKASSLLKTSDSATVYLVRSNNELSPITSFIVPNDFGLYLGVRTVSAANITAYTQLPVMQNKIKCGIDNYVANYGGLYKVVDAELARYGWTTTDFTSGGGLCNITPVGGNLGTFLLSGHGTIYLAEGGVKKPITSYAKYLNLGGSSLNTTYVSDITLSSIATGPNLN